MQSLSEWWSAFNWRPSLKSIKSAFRAWLIQPRSENCVRRGDRVLCSGSVTNKAEKARRLAIYYGQGSLTTAVDNNGNSYTSQQVDIGQANGGSQVQLMPELPTNFFLTFSAVEQ